MITVHALRLKPGQDLKKEVLSFVETKGIQAGWIMSCAGSLTKTSIRYANQENASQETGHFEIVSLSGTLSTDGSHIHISVSDSTGRTLGGHLLDENIVYTTAEIVIGESHGLIFSREKDGSTPWDELQIREK